MVNKSSGRLRRAKKTRLHIRRLNQYRLSVHRTLRHIYVQLIDPKGHITHVSASTLDPEFRALGLKTTDVQAAQAVGRMVAKRALEKGIKKVAFDRSGFKYHGRVKALADAAREEGLEF